MRSDEMRPGLRVRTPKGELGEVLPSSENIYEWRVWRIEANLIGYYRPEELTREEGCR